MIARVVLYYSTGMIARVVLYYSTGMIARVVLYYSTGCKAYQPSICLNRNNSLHKDNRSSQSMTKWGHIGLILE